jgi:hypothetical protein
MVEGLEARTLLAIAAVNFLSVPDFTWPGLQAQEARKRIFRDKS